ncbi:hypothetical protein MPTK1_1g05530 [Marchantia polymorpha subsp. ruderalis]|uniref:Photolyase/cryptochrome alpha/beta domain-containing protein n=2 Tax=Marchantia polymorpha TaxID=3197 RepID=A0AAF6ALV0_MARPO|nr:hypothetical protein MARPO_0005s0054 [Marchantia polymorpha]BBM97420.1 hypothetical protein Mp_1g05530 [Marchantia polymorpha subsp. ruderalis]|eukprot:PTQ48383.1 hypothetical protein MARPO_0005s0054 [Marchantia polymorpha]
MANFDDLELILDSNVERASGGGVAEHFEFEKPLQSNGCSSHLRERVNTAETGSGDGEEEIVVASRDDLDSSKPFMVPGAASLTMAMGSLLSLSHVSPPVHRLGFAPSKKVLKTDTSAKKTINSSPVVGASQMDVSMGSSITKTVKKSVGSISPFPDYQRLHGSQFGEPRNPAGLRKATIVWFRNDLRVHDNEALVQASNDSMSIVPVYCFDPRDYGKSSSGFDKTGPYRAKFLLECVSNLRDNLRERGSELIVRIGRPEEVLVSLAKTVGADALYAHLEVAHEEMNAEEKVSAALKEEGVESKYFWGSTLFHVDDLPFKLEDMPSNYGGFRDNVQGVEVRATIEAPKHLKGLPVGGSVKAGEIPSLQELGLNPSAINRPEKHTAYGGALLIGGENEALQRLRSFVVEASSLSETKSRTADKAGESLYGANFSCKISPWLAMGCLSPRRMFEDLHQSNKKVAPASAAKCGVTDDNGLNWLVFELLWRDFFRFITKKFGAGKKSSTPATACTGALSPA